MYRIIKTAAHWISGWSDEQAERRARRLAFFAFDVLRFRRQLILKNLAIAFGTERSEAERVRMGRESMRHFFLTMFEFLASVRRPLVSGVEVEGVEHTQAALAAGRGVYIVCGHFGNWEAAGPAGSKVAATVHGIVKEVGRGGANRLVDELRRASGVVPIYREPAGSALKQILAALNQNELVGFVLDQARPGAPRIPFFGTPAKTQTSLAAIWRKRPAPIIPIGIERLAYGRHKLRVWPPLQAEKTNDMEADILRITEQCNQILEEMIRVAPEQYFWLHNRWK